MAYLQRSARHFGFSLPVALQLACCRRRSTFLNYQSKWVVYRSWCRSQGHSISRPSVSKIADFLLFLHQQKHLSLYAISGYHSMLSVSFRFLLPELFTSTVLWDLLRSFSIARPVLPSRTTSWDLGMVLSFLRASLFEYLPSASLRDLTRKTLFLVALATAKRVGELQSISKVVAYSGEDIHLAYLPEFLAKAEYAILCVSSTSSVFSSQVP